MTRGRSLTRRRSSDARSPAWADVTSRISSFSSSILLSPRSPMTLDSARPSRGSRPDRLGAECCRMRKLGRYLLEDRLGAGSFATVWRAYDPELDTDVAVKVLADNWASNADVRQRFLAEARLLRRISSPRVVRVHDVGVQDDRPYFVMDYVRGGTLAEKVGHCRPAEALRLAAEAGYAVQVLHDAGVVHRDVKPSNLLLDTGRTHPAVLVADLGSAKHLADASGLTVTTGTPAYMAPEQAFQTGGFDGRADVYALGHLRAADRSQAVRLGRPYDPRDGPGTAVIVADASQGAGGSARHRHSSPCRAVRGTREPPANRAGVRGRAAVPRGRGAGAGHALKADTPCGLASGACRVPGDNGADLAGPLNEDGDRSPHGSAPRDSGVDHWQGVVSACVPEKAGAAPWPGSSPSTPTGSSTFSVVPSS
ncbi:serine/threonine-protein kinase [Streptomyces sp. NPDC001348]